MKKYVLLTIAISIAVMIGVVGVFASFEKPVGGFVLIEQKRRSSVRRSLENLKSAEDKLERNEIKEAKSDLEKAKTLLRNNEYHFEANQVERALTLIEEGKIDSTKYFLDQVQNSLEIEVNSNF